MNWELLEEVHFMSVDTVPFLNTSCSHIKDSECDERMLSNIRNNPRVFTSNFSPFKAILSNPLRH